MSRPQNPEATRLLPCNTDAEQGVLCSCLLSTACIGISVERGVSERWFHVGAHGMIYETVVELWTAGKPTDFIALTDEMRKQGLLDACGGPSKLTTLFGLLPTTANLSYYIDLLEEQYLARSIILVGTEFASKGYVHSGNVVEILDDFEKSAMGIRKIRNAKRADVQALTMEVLEDFQHAYDHPGLITGLRTGYRRFDEQVDGLQPEQFIVIGARPSHGKTAWALGVVEELAINQRKPLAVFSLEMSSKQLVKRLLCSMARVNWFRFKDGRVRESDLPALAQAASKLAACKDRLIIDDASGQSIQELRAKARRMRAENGIEAVFIDYLQLLRSTSKKAQENRSIEVSEVSTGCKEGARELGIPWVVLAQIGRDVEKNRRPPRLSDLKDSGSIEQDADLVAFLQRLDLNTDDEDERIALEGQAMLTIAKQRNGPIGDIPMTYLTEYTRYTDRAEETEQDELPLNRTLTKQFQPD